MGRNLLISVIIMQPSFWSQRTLPKYSELGTMKEGSHIWSLNMAWLAFPRFPALEAGYLCSRLIENIRAAFSTNQVQNLNQSWLGLPRFQPLEPMFVIRLKNSCHPFSQSGTKLKPIVTWFSAFSRPLDRSPLFLNCQKILHHPLNQSGASVICVSHTCLAFARC